MKACIGGERSEGQVLPGLARGLVLLQPGENGMAEQPTFRQLRFNEILLFVVFRFSEFGVSDDQASHRCCRSEAKDRYRLLRETASSKRISAPLSVSSITRNRSASHLKEIVRARFTVS